MKVSISKKNLREFGFLIGFAFPTLLGFVIPAFGGHAFRVWTLWIGIPSIIIAIINPNLLFYPYKGWMKLGQILGWINSRIILGLVFIIVLQPIAIIMKIFNYDPLRTRKNNQKSYRETIKEKTIDLNRIF